MSESWIEKVSEILLPINSRALSSVSITTFSGLNSSPNIFDAKSAIALDEFSSVLSEIMVAEVPIQSNLPMVLVRCFNRRTRNATSAPCLPE